MYLSINMSSLQMINMGGQFIQLNYFFLSCINNRIGLVLSCFLSVIKIEGVKKKMDKKKQLLLSIGLVLILVLMIVGISYAAFKFVGEGKNLIL